MFEPTADNQLGNVTNPAPVAEPATAPAPTEPPVVAPVEPQVKPTLTDFINAKLASNQEPAVPLVAPAPVAPEPIPGAGGLPKPDATPPNVTEPQDADIPDKFKNPDGSVNLAALAKSYVYMESMYGKSNNVQQLETLNQTNQQLQQLVLTMQQQIAQQAQNNAQPGEQLTPEELQAQTDAEVAQYWEDYNENPLEAQKKLFQKLFEETVKPVIEPIQQTQAEQAKVAEFQQKVQAWNDQVNTFAETHEDFDEMLPAMQEVVNEYKDVLNNREDALEIAYNFAKAKQAGTQSPVTPTAPTPLTVDELLKNQDLINQLAANPTVKNLILTQHMQEIKNNPAPPVIGSQPGGLLPSTQPVDLKNMKTAKEALKAKYAGVSLK